MVPINIGKWSKTWKSLILTYNLFELVLLVFQIWIKYFKNLYDSISIRFLYSIVMLHLIAICAMFLYVKNYKIMTKENPQKKSRAKFLLGLFLMGILEFVSVLFTIFL